MAGKGYTRWTADEYMHVAVNALPAIEAKKTRFEIMLAGMRAGLPRNRWRKQADLKHLCAPSLFTTFEKYVERARALPEAERARYITAQPDPSPLPPDDEPAPAQHTTEEHKPGQRKKDIGRDYKGGFRWTDHEKARIARMVRYWIDNGIRRPSDYGGLGRMFVEAQDLVLPPERRRSVNGIMQGNTSTGKGATWNEQIQQLGEQSIYLIAHEKFHPEGEYGPAAEERKRREERDAQEQRERSLRGNFVPPTTVAEVREVLSTPTPNATADMGGTTFEIPAETTPPGEQRTLPFPRSTGTLAEASRVFGDTVMNALEKLLAVHTNMLMQEFNARIAQTAASTGAAIAMQIEQTMRGTVQNIINEELGNPPAPPPAAERRQLKVDVVGFEFGAHEQTVAQSFNGDVDLRFVHPDKANAYAPHRGRHVIIVASRIPHSLSNKIRAANVEPIYVRRTPGHVVHAIEELMRAEGIEQTEHA